MRIEFSPTALRNLRSLPEKTTAACVEFIYGDLAESPLRVGKPLHGELEGQYSARRGTYRIVYSISNGDNPVIRIARVDHRRDVYR